MQLNDIEGREPNAFDDPEPRFDFLSPNRFRGPRNLGLRVDVDAMAAAEQAEKLAEAESRT